MIIIIIIALFVLCRSKQTVAGQRPSLWKSGIKPFFFYRILCRTSTRKMCSGFIPEIRSCGFWPKTAKIRLWNRCASMASGLFQSIKNQSGPHFATRLAGLFLVHMIHTKCFYFRINCNSNCEVAHDP
jgi:hypothetical protein